MFDKLFGIHATALPPYGQRLGVLAGNIANADTPGYKARDIDFAAVLGQGLTPFPGEAGGAAPLAVATTSALHIATATADGPAADILYRNPYQASLDGNTVEMAVEQAAFAENNVRYQAEPAADQRPHRGNAVRDRRAVNDVACSTSSTLPAAR